MNSLRMGQVQINTIVGDLDGNYKKIIQSIKQAERNGCDLVVLPELAITGYPPEDLLLRPHFIKAQRRILDDIIRQNSSIITVLGFVDQAQGDLYNAAAVIQDQSLKAVYHKIELPNYSVFDEERYFTSGSAPLVLDVGSVKVGISICEDIWVKDSVIECEALTGGAEILVNISASPFTTGKNVQRYQLIREHCRRTHSIMAYTNLVGGQDELVFDGQSLVMDDQGDLIAAGRSFETDLIQVDLNVSRLRERREQQDFSDRVKNCTTRFRHVTTVDMMIQKSEKPVLKASDTPLRRLDATEELYKALILGLKDYVSKNGFTDVVFGLSGGIDSALVSAIAVDALGSEHVHPVIMPSQYSTRGSVDDSELLCRNMGLESITLPIRSVFDSVIELLKPVFSNLAEDVTEENLQARIRGNLVMALSNKFGWLALATGNKSELSVGYCTIYGDMVGGFAPLMDVKKGRVYRLAKYRNAKAGFDFIPNEIMNKQPSAELKPDQQDQDSLPPYDELDEILRLYIEHSMGAREIIEAGHDPETVTRITALVDRNEYKRRQAAPGIKITSMSFGKDRRMPITNHYRRS
ncbi:MAG: NAD+ synthase [candidate division KSB1 bacterium]|nr:NAD+ synthase [candidate division KSB1 bacterium]